MLSIILFLNNLCEWCGLNRRLRRWQLVIMTSRWFEASATWHTYDIIIHVHDSLCNVILIRHESFHTCTSHANLRLLGIRFSISIGLYQYQRHWAQTQHSLLLMMMNSPNCVAHTIETIGQRCQSQVLLQNIPRVGGLFLAASQPLRSLWCSEVDRHKLVLT